MFRFYFHAHPELVFAVGGLPAFVRSGAEQSRDRHPAPAIRHRVAHAHDRAAARGVRPRRGAGRAGAAAFVDAAPQTGPAGAQQ